MIISIVDCATDKYPTQLDDVDFQDFAESLSEIAKTPLAREDKTLAKAFVPASFDGKLIKANLIARYAFTGDVDDGGNIISFSDMSSVLDELGYSYILATTTKSTQLCNRYRIIIPFKQGIDSEIYETVWWSIHKMLGEVCDTATFDSSRISFVPQKWEGKALSSDRKSFYEPSPPDAWHDDFAYRIGKAIDHEEIISLYPSDRPQKTKIVRSSSTSKSIVIGPTTGVYPLWLFSNLLTDSMVDKYSFSPMGRRFFRLLCSLARRMVEMGFQPDSSVILPIALEVSGRFGKPYRENAEHEAGNAIQWVNGSA